MLRLLTDENVNGDLVSALRRRQSDLDIVRVQELGLTATDDEHILEWAAAEKRILITNDQRTMIGFAYQRVTARRPMPGVFLLRPGHGTRDVIEAILLVANCTTMEEWQDRVEYLPFAE